jgi:hypothetical protein
MIIEVTEFKNPGEPFPRKAVRSFLGYKEVMDAYGLTLNEVDKGIKKKAVIRERFLIDLAPAFLNEIRQEGDAEESTTDEIVSAMCKALRETAIDDIIAEHRGGLEKDEILKVLGISARSFDDFIYEAKNKLSHMAKIRELAGLVNQLNNLSDSGSYRIVSTTEITVSYE